jgi:CheY-like chemotaxis protein
LDRNVRIDAANAAYQRERIMMMQLTYLVEDCPICGRPVEIAMKAIGHKVVCGHCQGQFVVVDANDGGVRTVPFGETNLLERADQLLEVTAKEAEHESIIERPIAVVAEPRDEVFARLAMDIAAAGMKVVRAKTATEAIRHCATYQPTLIVSNLDLPDQSGWLLAGKLRFIDPDLRVWLYQPRTSPYEKGMARFLKVDELLDYGGDLLGLSETVIQLIADNSEPNSAAGKAATLAAA